MARSSFSPKRYTRVHLLGEGGAGKVWLVTDRLQGDRTLALKELPIPDEGRIAALRAEFLSLASLRHPNLAEVHEFHLPQPPELPHFTLEYVDGLDLVTAVRGGEAETLLNLTAEALRALCFLHDFGIVHRDIKPANILVRKEPHLGCRLILLDFGLALARGDAATGPVGTLPYLAPELFEGAPAGIASDLYALAAVIHEAVLGKPPVPLERDDSLATFVKRLTEVPREPIDWPERFPRGLDRWLDGLLSQDPGERPANASEALAQLNSLCGTDFSPETQVTRAARLESGPPPGREDELRRLTERLDDESGPEVILLTGETGSGKSRLLRWLAAQGVRRGRTVRTRLPEDGDPGGSADGSMWVFLDDPETLGPTTVDTICRNARGANTSGVRIVTALNPAEIHGESLGRLVGDAELLKAVERVELAPLKAPGVASVVRRLFPAEAKSSPRAEWLADTSEGNTASLVSLLVDEAWENRQRLRVPPTLQASIVRRLDTLTDSTRRWLEALSVLGRDAERWRIAQLGGVEAPAGERAAAELTFLGLVTDEDGRVSPASTTVSELVLARTADAGRVGLHRRAAQMLAEEASEGEADVGRLARLWSGAGDHEQAVGSALLLAATASRSTHHEQAARWYRFAIAHLPRRDVRRVELQRSRATALSSAGQHIAAYRALASALRGTPDPVMRVEIRAEQAFELGRAGRSDRALVVADEAIRLAGDTDATRAVAQAQRAKAAVLARLQRNEEGLPLALNAAAKFEAEGDSTYLLESLNLAGLCCSNLRRFDEGRGYLERSISLARRSQDGPRLARAVVGMAILERRDWNLVKTLEHTKMARQVAQSADLASLLSFILFAEANALQDLGKLDEAMRTCQESISVSRNAGDRSWLFLGLVLDAHIGIRIGRPVEAAAKVRHALQEYSKWTEPRTRGYAMGTIAEASIESSDPDFEMIADLVSQVRTLAKDDRKLAMTTQILEMEAQNRAAAGSAPDTVWAALRTEMERHPDALEPSYRVRGEIVYAEGLLRKSRFDEAKRTAVSAASYAEEKNLPAMAARAHAVIAESKRQLGDSAAAAGSLATARERLDEAASRIGDVEMRRGFLDRAVFRGIRRPTADSATGGESRLVAIYDMIRALNTESDPDQLLETMMDMALDVVQAERGLILLRDRREGEYSVRLARNLEKETIRDATEFSRNVVLRAGTGQAVLAIDTDEDERFRDLRSVSVYGIRSVICVPLRSREEIVGAVYMANRRQGALFTPDDLRFLEAFADHAALALENARIRRELEQENLRLQVAADERVRFDSMIGRSGPMQKVYDLIPKMAASSLPVLVQGESGTGKELVARAINSHSPRQRKAFLSENCAAIPESLLESELFGHVRGAFTGAERDRVGLFEQADGGTLFLDEIGDMPASMQARLLRVLQEGELRRVGGERRIHVDVRVITATHRDLETEVEAGRFREDLYYRLQVLLIQLPPLRERAGDIPLLVDHFLRRISRERGRPVPELRTAVLSLLESYSWPGNVRQLENHIQRMVLLAGDGPITTAVIQSDDGLRGSLFGKQAQAAPVFLLERSPQERIRQALIETKGNRVRAARLLGISRATIFRKIKEYGLD